MLVAVAGASGRLGQSFVKKLVANGYPVVALVRSKSSLGKIPKGAKHRFVDYGGSVAELRSTLEDVTHIVNITGSTSTHLSLDELRNANVEPTKKLLEAAPSSLQKFIHISSISVYGKKLDGLCDETCEKKADTAYARTKLESEKLVLSHAKNFDILILEPGMIFGPGFVEGFYPILRRIVQGKMKLIGDGTNYMPLVHVEDVSDAILRAIDSSVPSGSVYLIVTEPQLTQAQLVDMAASALGSKSPMSSENILLARFAIRLNESYSRLVGKKPSITSDMIEQLCSNRCFSSKKAAMELRWKSSVPFKMGIDQVVNQFIEENNLGNLNGKNRKISA